jgi:hypothetical protein
MSSIPKYWPFYLLISALLFCFNAAFAQQELLIITFGNDIVDSSRYHNQVNVIGSPQIYTDRFNNPCGARYFNGTTDYLLVPHSNLFNRINRSFTLTCWVKIPFRNINWLTLVCKGEKPTETINNPHFRVQAFQSTTQSTISINTEFTEYDYYFNSHFYPINTWFMYTLVYDGSIVQTFINNKLVWSYPYANQLFSNLSDLYICRDIPGSDEYFLGALDDLKLYDYPFNYNQINDLFNAKAPSMSGNLNFLNFNPVFKKKNDPGLCSARLNFVTPSINDNCNAGIVTQISGLSSGSEFPVGQSNIVFKGEVSGRNPQFCTSSIQIDDNEPPLIECLKDTLIKVNEYSNNRVQFFYSMPKASDNCKVEKLYEVKNKKSGIYLNPGQHIFEFEAVDKAGNKSFCKFIVNVVSEISISQTTSINSLSSSISLNNNNINTIVCPDDLFLLNDSNYCGAFPEIPNGFKVVSGIGKGSIFPVGKSSNVLFNSNTLDTCYWSVTVEDGESPKLSCDIDTIIKANENNGFSGTVPFPCVTDNCKLKSLKRIDSLSNSLLIPIGVHVFEYEATDIFGNTSVIARNIQVISDLKPANIEKTYKVNSKLQSDSLKIEQVLNVNFIDLVILMHDNGQEDNDTISVFFNEIEIVTKECIKRLKNKPIIRRIELSGITPDTIYFKAWNNGRILPNTLQVDIHDSRNKLRYFKRWSKIRPVISRNIASRPGITSSLPLQFQR